MPLHRTRSMASDADFEFILTTIPGMDEDSPLTKQALEKDGIFDAGGVSCLSNRDIDQLKHRDDSSGALEE